MNLAADKWDRPQRSEVLLPSPHELASVLVMGLFALALSGLGLGWTITRFWRRR